MSAYAPDVRDVHVNKLLTDLSVGYINAEYIADTLFPIVFVDKQADAYTKYDKSHWFRDEAQVRAPGTVAVRGGWSVDNTNTYYCRNWAYGKDIPDEIRANADAAFDLDRDATAFVTDKLQMRRERAWASSFFTTGVWAQDKAGGTNFTKFSDYGASSPIKTLRDYSRSIRQLIARRPNILVLGEFGFDVLADHPDFIERIKGAASPGNPAVVTPQLIASVLRLERIAIGSAMYTATAEGVAEASATYSDIFDDDGLLMYVPASPSLMTPAAGYTFIWRSMVNSRAPQFIRRLRDDKAMTDIIEGHSYFDQKLTASDAGLYLSDMVD